MLDDSVAFRKFPKIMGLSIATPLAAVSASSAVLLGIPLGRAIFNGFTRMGTAVFQKLTFTHDRLDAYAPTPNIL